MRAHCQEAFLTHVVVPTDLLLRLLQDFVVRESTQTNDAQSSTENIDLSPASVLLCDVAEDLLLSGRLQRHQEWFDALVRCVTGEVNPGCVVFLRVTFPLLSVHVFAHSRFAGPGCPSSSMPSHSSSQPSTYAWYVHTLLSVLSCGLVAQMR